MSPKNSLLTAGLTALGLCGFAPLGVADPAPPAPSGSEASVAPNPSYAVLLLTDGRLEQGPLTENGDVYLVSTKRGKLPIRKANVEKIGRSVQDIYEYMRSRLPERDPDEHMKLARWALSQGLRAEAVTQLRAVLALSPDHPQAQTMIDQQAGAEERAQRRDPDVGRAGAEVPEGRPAGPDAAMIGRAQRALGISGLPQIPGLPQAMAAKRTGEFIQFIDPLLQKRCAKCHDEQYDGSFQLVRYKTKGDQTADARRSNLDAVLALIDMENPVRSELLSSTLRVHGKGSNARPIFRGANDREYQVLATWVNRLRTAPQTAQSAAPPTRFDVSTPAQSGGETFAASRYGSASLPPLTPTPRPAGQLDPSVPASLPPATLAPGADNQPLSPPDPVDSGVIPSNVRVTRHTGAMDHPSVAPDASFPTPFSVAGAGAAPRNGGAPALAPAPAPAAGALPPLPAAGAAPGAVPASAGTIPKPVPGAAPVPGPAAPGLPPDDEIPAVPARAKKPLKIDPAKLEKALMNRFAPQ